MRQHRASWRLRATLKNHRQRQARTHEVVEQVNALGLKDRKTNVRRKMESLKSGETVSCDNTIVT